MGECCALVQFLFHCCRSLVATIIFSSRGANTGERSSVIFEKAEDRLFNTKPLAFHAQF